MENGQTNLKTEEQEFIDDRTSWQKSEYERRRVSYRKEFKNLCLKHIQFLKRKESIIDFGRLLNVWQLYIKYKKLEAMSLLKFIATQGGALSIEQQNNIRTMDSLFAKTGIDNKELLTGINLLIDYLEFRRKNIDSNIGLLDKQIIDINHDLDEVKNKNAMIHESLAKFVDEYPDKPELTGKDFVHVVQEDNPQVHMDGSITSDLADIIRLNLLNDAHKSELKIELIHGSMQELEIVELLTILEARKNDILQQKSEHDKFNEYLTTKKAILASIADRVELQAIQADIRNYKQIVQTHYDNTENEHTRMKINLELDKNHFDNGIFQLSLLDEQEKAELTTFDYRTFKQQEVIFKRSYKRNQEQDLDMKAELERKLIDIRDYKDNRQQQIRADFKLSRVEIGNNINKGKTPEEIAELKVKHKVKYAKDTVIMFAVKDTVLPIPPTPVESKFNLDKERREVIVAIAQIVCESLGRLALATDTRSKPKTPQEHAGLLYLNDPSMADILHKHTDNEDNAVADLGKTRKEICKLGEEINQLIKGLE